MKCRGITEMQLFSVTFAVVLQPYFKVFPLADEKRRQMKPGKRHNKLPCQVYAEMVDIPYFCGFAFSTLSHIMQMI